ncbi:MAG: hypothetical protein VYC39_13070 [Myxococcota bacterium]|nr:hypothetical protein [Myxococcota bacterium]
MSFSRTNFVALFGSSIILATGCASTTSIRVYEESAPKHAIKYFGVSAVQLLYEGQTLEGSQRTQRLLDFLSEKTKWSIVPSNEFSVVNPLETDPIRKTDLLLRLKSPKNLAHKIALLETTVSFRESKGRATIRASTGTMIGRAHEIDLVIRMTVSGENGRVLFDAESVTRVDPFAITPDFDSRSYVDVALSALADTMVEELEGHVLSHQREIKLFGRPTINGLKSYPSRTLRSLHSPQLGQMEKDIRHWHILQYFDSTATIDDAKHDASKGIAFCLTKELENTSLRSGDCIISIGQKSIANAHQLYLYLGENPKTKTFLLKVLRAGTSVPVDVSLTP